MAKKYIDYKTSFHALGYVFRLNELNDVIECNGTRLTDTIDAEIKSKMGDVGFGSRPRVKEAWKRLAGENRYHPIREYFERLPVWSGQDSFGQLMSFFDFKHRAFAHTAIRKFMIGTIAKVFEQHRNFMLVIDGKQMMGKSYFSRWLCPIEKYFVEGALNPDHNDTKLRTMSYFMWEVAEFQSTTRKSDQEALKNIISQSRMTARRPYSRYDLEKPITVSFIGTINENGNGMLTDSTGSTRFATINILNINHDYTKINREDLWSQIYFSYLNGEKGELTLPERNTQEYINKGYEMSSLATQLFFANYEIDTLKYVDNWISIAEIISTLELQGLKMPQRISQMDISALLIKEGCERSNKSTITGCGRQTCYNGIEAIKQANPKINVWGKTP